jgi:SnoaL-like polyketide cyclase
MLGGLFEVEQASLRLEILTARRIGAWNHPEQRKRSPKHEAAQISFRTKVALAAARAKALGGRRPRRPISPLPASGARTQFDFGAVFRMADGKIAEWWITWDNMTVLRQLGHMPVEGATIRPID